MGPGGPDPVDLAVDLPRVGHSHEQDERRPHGAHALPRGPVQRPAHHHGALPRHRPRGLLLRRRLLAGTRRPHPAGRRPPGPLLPDAEDARPGGGELLAVQRLHHRR